MKRQFERWIATSALLLAGACKSDGGVMAGAGAVSAPAGGAKPPTAAGMTGGGAAGTPAGSGMKCSMSALPGPMLHQAAVAAIVPVSMTNKLPCAFSSCHDVGQKKAGLNLDVGTMDLKATLVGKPSCEAPTINLVDGSGGDAALAKSWLWMKLTAPTDASAGLIADPAWGAGNLPCSLDSGQPFGVKMPKAGGTEGLSETRLSAIRDWICAGAPGPQ